MPEYVTAESDGFTVSSNTATEEALQANFTPAAVEDAPVEADPTEDAAPVVESEATKAAKTLAAQKKKTDPSKDPGAKKQSIQAQIDADTKRKYDAKREADAETARLETLRQERAALEQPAAKPDTSGKPKRDDFVTLIGTTYASYEEANDAYDDARDDWRAQTTAQQQREAAQRQFQADTYAKAQERIDAFKAAHDDYDTVVGAAFIPPGAVSGQAVIDHLNHSEMGPQLAYHLGQYPAELARIAGLPFGFAIAALGRLEAKYDLQDTAAPTTGPAAIPPRTNAKPPFKPVGGSPVASDDGEVPDDLPFDEHVKRMNALDLKAARRR